MVLLQVQAAVSKDFPTFPKVRLAQEPRGKDDMQWGAVDQQLAG